MKKILNLCLYSLILLALLNCRDKEDNKAETIINSNFDYTILKGGKYVFDDPNFKKDNIRVLYLKNGEWKEYYEYNLDPKYGYFFYNRENHTYIRLFPTDYDKDGIENLKIKYDETTTDDIKAEFSYRENSEALTKIWYNGKEFTNPTSSAFTIEK